MSDRYEGVTEAEAAIKACEAMGVSRSQLKYDVVSREGGVVAIEVTGTKEAQRSEPPRRAAGDFDRDRGGRDRGDRGGFGGGGRGRGDRHGGRRPPRDRADGGDDEFSDRLAEEYKEFREMTAAPKEPVARRQAIDTPSETAKRALEIVRELMKLGEFEMDAQVSVDGSEGIEIDLHGSDEGLIIGRKGETLLALQFIINRIVSRDNESIERILIDCEGYRVRRQQALKQLALRLGEKAKSEKRTITVTAMNAHDRRIFHVTLDGHEGLHTRSEGDGLYRKLLIIPEAAASATV